MEDKISNVVKQIFDSYYSVPQMSEDSVFYVCCVSYISTANGASSTA